MLGIWQWLEIKKSDKDELISNCNSMAPKTLLHGRRWCSMNSLEMNLSVAKIGHERSCIQISLCELHYNSWRLFSAYALWHPKSQLFNLFGIIKVLVSIFRFTGCAYVCISKRQFGWHTLEVVNVPSLKWVVKYVKGFPSCGHCSHLNHFVQQQCRAQIWLSYSCQLLSSC